MVNKTILITGTTNGLGKEITKLLAKNNNLILLGRNKVLLSQLKTELTYKYPNQQFDYFICDFNSLDSVEKAFKEISNNYSSIDIIIHNAGALIKSRREIIHPALMVNYISPMLLNELLLPLLKKSNEKVIFYTSTMSIPKKVNEDIINNMGDYKRIKTYSIAKLLFNLYLKDLQVKSNLTIKIFDPGIVYTNAVKSMFPKYLKVFSPFAKLIARNPKKVAVRAVEVLYNKQSNNIEYYKLNRVIENREINNHYNSSKNLINLHQDLIKQYLK